MTTKNKDPHKYTLEVTEDQYSLIIYATELASRLESGQLHELVNFGGPVMNLTHGEIEGILNPDLKTLEGIVDKLKNKLGLMSDESVGIRQSTQRAKELYEIYYTMKHHESVKNPYSINVYKNKLMRLTNKPLIKIKKT